MRQKNHKPKANLEHLARSCTKQQLRNIFVLFYLLPQSVSIIFPQPFHWLFTMFHKQATSGSAIWSFSFLFFPLAADFTFNPENLNLNLILSEDHRQVTSVPIWPFKCCNNGILGSKCFLSGKHYWEVDVSEKNAWTLGVYSRKRTLKFDVRRCSKSQPNDYHRYKPQNGYWVIGLQDGSKYSIFEDSSNCDPTVLNPFVATPLHRIGVFLDCEEGIVSFFNVTNHGSLIYKFTQCRFSQPAYPYFNPWDCPAPMTLCPRNAWVFSFSSVSDLPALTLTFWVYLCCSSISSHGLPSVVLGWVYPTSFRKDAYHLL